MRKLQNQRAFVDPLSLIAVVLLVVTLAVTTVTVNDPLKKQLISSYAKEKSNFQSYADSLIRQRERSGKCKGSGCVAEEVINNQATQGNNSTAAQSAQTEAEQKIIDMYNKAKAGDLNALNDLKKSNSSLGEQVQKELDAKAAAAPKVEESKPPADLTLNQLVGNSSNENAFVSKESQAAQKQLTSYLDEQKAKKESEEQAASQNTGSPKNTTAANNAPTIVPEKPKYESQSDCEKNTNPYSPEFKGCSKYASPEENKGNVWDNLVDLSSIFKGVIDTPSTNSVNNQNSLSALQLNTSDVTLPTTSGSTDVYVPKYSSKLECEQNTQKGSREQKACGQFATSNENIKTIFNTLDTVTFGTFSDYAESYAPQNVEVSWKAAGYENLKSCQQDMLDKYHNPNAASSCNTYQITKDQLSSSVKLGTVITAEGALAVTGAGYGSGAITGAQALTNGLAISTVYQTGSASSTCIDDPGSQECKDEAKYAALSWANVFTAAGLAGATQNTVQAWRYANAAVNAVNVAADVKDTINSCTGENASGLGCTISSVATLLDVGGGALDVVEIAKDFNFSGLSGDIGGWPVDAFPAKTNTITDVIPRGTTITDITESIAPTNVYTDFTNIDNIMADISVSQITDIPNAESIPTFSNDYSNGIAANLPQSFDSSFGNMTTDFASDITSSQASLVSVGNNSSIFESPTKWIEKNIVEPVSNIFAGSNVQTNQITENVKPSKLTSEEAQQVINLVPDAVKAKYIQAIKETGGISSVQFDENRFWSMNVKPKDTRLPPEAVEELMDRLTVGTLNAHGSMIISPKGDHMVFIDVDPNRESSIAKVATFLEEKVPGIIRDVYLKYGIEIDPKDINLANYVGYGVGFDSIGPFKLNVLESGHVNQQATLSSGVITGSSLALATENIPDTLRGDGFLPILIQSDSNHPNLVTMALEDKGFTLEGYVLPKNEIGQIVESVPNMEIRANQSLIEAATPTAFETYFSPEAWKEVLTPEQFNQIGKSPVKVTLPDADVTSVELDVVNVNVPGAVVGGLDASPISKIVGEIRNQFGEGSGVEAGLRTILSNWFSDQAKIINSHGLAMGGFAGDGFNIVSKEKLPPNVLSDLADMTTSLDKNIANAAKGQYGQDAKAAAEFLDINFHDEMYVKLFFDKPEKTSFKFLIGDGYTPVILTTSTDTEKMMKQIKNYKAEFGNKDKIATVSKSLIENYTDQDLKKAGLKIIENEHGIFLVKRGNPVVEWVQENIWSADGILFPSLEINQAVYQ